MKLFEVHPQTCNQDGLCAAVCPVGIISFAKGAVPFLVAGAEEICVRCGHCVAVCPTGSLNHRDVPLEQCPPVHPEWRLSAEQGEHFLRSRRSIRVYKDTPIPRSELTRLIEIARYAPSGLNSQGTQWLVLGDRAELGRLATLVVDWMGWMQVHMEEVAAALHLDRTIARWQAGEDVILRGAPAVIVAHAPKDDRMAPSTCTIALTYLELAAISLGLGTCWAGYFNAAANSFPPMLAALALPAGHQCFGAMMVGYPQHRYHRLPTRNTPHITWRMG